MVVDIRTECTVGSELCQVLRQVVKEIIIYAKSLAYHLPRRNRSINIRT